MPDTAGKSSCSIKGRGVERHGCLRLWMFALCVSSAPIAQAESPAGSYRLTLLAASDWLYHGTTETAENPTLGVNLDWELGTGLFVGAEAHQAIENGVRQRQRSLMAYAGTTIPAGRQWLVSPSISYRSFLNAAKSWDFVELSLDVLSPGGLGIRFDYSPDYYDHNSRSFAAEARYLGAIEDTRHYWFIKTGLVELSNPNWQDHVYAQAGIGSSVGPVNLELTAHWNNQGDNRSFGREAYSKPGFVLRMAYRLH